MKLIVAVDEKWGIGKNNDLLFRNAEDMNFFRETTAGRVVLMGHSTLKSFPNSKPLKNRINIILSRDEQLRINGAICCSTIKQALEIAKLCHNEDVYVIGGASIYMQLLDYCSEAIITKNFADGNADCFFPNLDEKETWELAEQSELKDNNGVDFCFCKYINKNTVKF